MSGSADEKKKAAEKAAREKEKKAAENALPARVLQLRARVALGQAEDVLADVQGDEAEPDLAAVAALAEFALGKVDDAVKRAEELAQASADNATVQVLAGTVLQGAGKSEEALALLGQHQGSRTSSLPTAPRCSSMRTLPPCYCSLA